MLIEVLLVAALHPAPIPQEGQPATSPLAAAGSLVQVAETEGRITAIFKDGPTIVLDKAPHGLKSADLGGRVADMTVDGRVLGFEGGRHHPIASSVASWRVQGSALELALDIDVEKGPRTFKETFQPVTVEGVVGLERRVHQVIPKDQKSATLDDVRVIVLETAPTDRRAGDKIHLSYYGHSTVAQSGITYIIRSSPTPDGGTLWSYRSCFNDMSQVMNSQLDPAIRDIVFFTAKDAKPLTARKLVEALVTHAPDVECLALTPDLGAIAGWTPRGSARPSPAKERGN